MLDWTGARQMKDDLVLALPDRHGDLEQLRGYRRRLGLRERGMLQSLRPQLLVQDAPLP